MLNLEQTLFLNPLYLNSKDIFPKSFLASFAAIVLIDLLRGQISEINVLQLVPGFYIIVLFFSFLFFIGFSDFFVRIPIESDFNKSLGTKTLVKLNFSIRGKNNLYILFGILYFSLTNIVPISFDSLDTYGEKTLENIWSFDEIISLEINLIVILIIMSQIPTFLLFTFNTERFVNRLPAFWKILSFSILLIAGFLTPTVDGYTQLNFSISAILLYLYIISLIEKRLNNKFNGLMFFG